MLDVVYLRTVLSKQTTLYLRDTDIHNILVIDGVFFSGGMAVPGGMRPSSRGGMAPPGTGYGAAPPGTGYRGVRQPTCLFPFAVH